MDIKTERRNSRLYFLRALAGEFRYLLYAANRWRVLVWVEILFCGMQYDWGE